MMPLSNVKSIRQELIKLRDHNPEVEEISKEEDGCLKHTLDEYVNGKTRS